jgi:oxygen-dependent protoporphyrinogen oxidase
VLPVENHFKVSYKNKPGEQVEIETKKVISTIGAYNLQSVLPFIDKESISKLTALHYTRVIEAAIGFNKWEGFNLDAFGGLIPFKENRDMLGVLFMSSLFEDRAPKDGALLSVFLGGVRRPDIFTKSENEIKEILNREICDLMQIKKFNPELLKIIRHEWAIPQYEVDSGERFDTIEALENKYPGLIIGGNLRNGIGMADRLLQARMLADAAV